MLQSYEKFPNTAKISLPYLSKFPLFLYLPKKRIFPPWFHIKSQLLLINAILEADPVDSYRREYMGMGGDAPLAQLLPLAPQPTLEGAVADPAALANSLLRKLLIIYHLTIYHLPSVICGKVTKKY